ncbi:MAG: hypothetical protein IKZ04_04085, partial [Spirochaetaceae bacterium]|nr:hypothetical protein [Spirochaetaceae bacterium]
VKNGEGTITYVQDENQEIKGNYDFSTIDQLFLFIEKSFKKEKEIFDKTDIGIINYEITYNSDYGYPETVSLFSCFDYIEIENNVWVAPVGINPLVIEIKNFQN